MHRLVNTDMQRVEGGAERTTVQGFNGAGKAVLCCAVLNSLGAFSPRDALVTMRLCRAITEAPLARSACVLYCTSQ